MGRQKGYVMSEETKRKLSESHKGKVFTEAHKQHMSESAKKRVTKPVVHKRVDEMLSKRCFNILVKYGVKYGVDSTYYLFKESDYIAKGHLKPNYDKQAVINKVKQELAALDTNQQLPTFKLKPLNEIDPAIKARAIQWLKGHMLQ